MAAAAAICGLTRWLRAPRPWRPSKLRFEVRRAALAGRGDVGVHAQAHRAARAAPVEAGGAEDLVEALGLGLALHLHRARDDHRVDVRGHPAALDDRGGGAQVADARVRARADEDAVERGCPASACPAAGPCRPARAPRPRWRLGHGVGHRRRPAPGSSPSVTIGLSAPASTDDLLVEGRAVVGAQPAQAGSTSTPRSATQAKVVSSGATMPGAAAALDRHVADRHAALHRQRLDGGPGELDDVAGGAVDAHLADRPEDEVLGRDAEAEARPRSGCASTRLALHEHLRRQHVLDLARADAEGQRAEGAVGGGVAVAADDRHPGLGHAELGPDDVDDALVLGAERVAAGCRTRRSCARASRPACARARRGCARRPGCRRWARCGRPWPACGRAGGPGARPGAARRRPAGS